MGLVKLAAALGLGKILRMQNLGNHSPNRTNSSSSHQEEVQLISCLQMQKDLYERLLSQKEVQAEDMHHFIVIASALVGLIVVSLGILIFCLMRARSNQQRCSEALTYKYEGLMEEKNNRIQELLKQLQENASLNKNNSTEHHDGLRVQAHQIIPQQQPIVYAFPGYPPASTNTQKG